MKAQPDDKKKRKSAEESSIHIGEIGGLTGGTINIAGRDIVQKSTKIDTGGGAYLAGNVSTGGGDFVGRDSIKFDEILESASPPTKGNLQRPPGERGLTEELLPGSQFNLRGLQLSSGTSLLEHCYTLIDLRPADPNVDKDEIRELVKRLEDEIGRGDQANVSKVERWLKSLGAMAPDVFTSTALSLANSTSEVTGPIREAAERLRTQFREWWNQA
jgi:hypothetical protein